ncbi:hypothetical protein [Xanthomonas sp. BRIP62411]|uniref:hypothetical protein n=1 Tax=Xanthomonas sp. BRIP62411 TaxID=2182389 RepID=UPI000F8E382C|nr:hypothetical protein [Xanthomonas sp. BRIP62411]
MNEHSGNSGQLQGEQRARELLAAEVDLDAVLMPEREGAKEVADSIRDGGDGNIPFVSTALRAIVATLAARQPVGQEPVEFDYPEFHHEGMGCGLEDRGITDRYEAMRYGFNEALDQMASILESIGPLYTAPPGPAAVPVALGAVDTIPCNWSDEDESSLIMLRDSLSKIIAGTTTKDAAHFLKQPGQRRMTIKDAQESAAAHLPYVQSLVHRATGLATQPQPAAANTGHFTPDELLECTRLLRAQQAAKDGEA